MKQKYIGIYTINVAGCRTRIKRKRLNPSDPVVSFGKNTVFNVNFKAPMYRTRKSIFYFFEQGKGQVVGNSKELQGNELVAKSLFLDELPKQLTSGIEHKNIFDIENIILIAMSFIAGVGMGYILLGLI